MALCALFESVNNQFRNPFWKISMSKTETAHSENAHSSCSASGQIKCVPVCLLLLVGFIFGFSAGFGTHDFVHVTISKAMYGNKSLVSGPIQPEEKGKPGEKIKPTEEEVKPADETDKAAEPTGETPSEEAK